MTRTGITHEMVSPPTSPKVKAESNVGGSGPVADSQAKLNEIAYH